MRIIATLATATLSLGLLVGCTAESEPAPSSSRSSTSMPQSAPESTSAAPAPQVVVPSEIYPTKPATTSLSCSAAVAAAAAVPGSMNNNNEIYVTFIACDSVDDWGSAVVANPGIFAVSSVAPSEIAFYVTIACAGAEETPVCVDAAAQGLF